VESILNLYKYDENVNVNINVNNNNIFLDTKKPTYTNPDKFYLDRGDAALIPKKDYYKKDYFRKF
jgi:hypothetical protein